MDHSKPIRDYDRPWGGFDQYTHNEQTTVKVLWVKKGERNSLQWHEHRDEMWVILAGPVKVTIGEEEKVGNTNDVFHIPARTKHRFEGAGEDNRLLEISFGNFDENDNHRIEDDYGRA